MSEPTPLEGVRKVLKCLYIDASKEAADDVNAKVEFYIQQAEAKLASCEADKARLVKVAIQCRTALQKVAGINDEFFLDVDGFFYWWPHGSPNGCFASHHLRELADELDRRNRAWNETIKMNL